MTSTDDYIQKLEKENAELVRHRETAITGEKVANSIIDGYEQRTKGMSKELDTLRAVVKAYKIENESLVEKLHAFENYSLTGVIKNLLIVK